MSSWQQNLHNESGLGSTHRICAYKVDFGFNRYNLYVGDLSIYNLCVDNINDLSKYNLYEDNLSKYNLYVDGLKDKICIKMMLVLEFV